MIHRWKWLGFTTTTSSGIDHSGPVLWIIFHGPGDTGRNISKRSFIKRSIAGFAAAAPSEHFAIRILETLVELDPRQASTI